MRSEVTAFRELDSLVRSLTEQLAVYRRRALAAETRVKDLEYSMQNTQGQLDQAVHERALAEASAKELADAMSRATQRNAEYQQLLESAEASKTQADGAAEQTVNPLAEENAQLRARLAEARERSTELGARVRFLRQQMAQGAERP